MSRLQELLDAEADGFDGRVGYALANLTTGERVTRRDGDAGPTASSIKLPILTAFHAFVGAGDARWDDEVAIATDLSFGGSGILQHLALPRITYRDAAWLMICLSDNLATNLLLAAMTVDGANDIIRAVVGDGIRVNNYAGVQTGPPIRSMGTATPAALGHYLGELAALRLPGAEETIAVARQQQGGATISRYLPVNAFAPGALRVASKSGAMPGIRTGIALLEEGGVRATVSIMVADAAEDPTTTDGEAEKRIGRMVRIAYDTWLAADA